LGFIRTVDVALLNVERTVTLVLHEGRAIGAAVEPSAAPTLSGVAQGLAVGHWLEDRVAASNPKLARVVGDRGCKWASTAPVFFGTAIGPATVFGRLVPGNGICHKAIGDVNSPGIVGGAIRTAGNHGYTGRSSKDGDRLSHVDGHTGCCSVPANQNKAVGERVVNNYHRAE
jgi:hypothetical protein